MSCLIGPLLLGDCGTICGYVVLPQSRKQVLLQKVLGCMPGTPEFRDAIRAIQEYGNAQSPDP
jgi:hypothetical protein